MSLQHILKNSSVSGKEPLASQLANGELSINYHADGPFLCCKDTAGNVRRVAGVWVATTAPSTPFPGELWLDTSSTPTQLKVYKNTTDNWVFAGQVNSATTTYAGVVQLATNGETQTGTNATSAVTPASLQSKISDSTTTVSATTIASSTAVKSVGDLASAALLKSGGTITGTLEIGNTGQIRFEGSSNDAYETTLAVEDPTAPRTITLPDRSGTVITTGDTGTVTNTMLAGSIADSKLSAISTADKVSLSALNIDGATDIGGALSDADLFVVDDGANGTNRKAPATRISDYTFGKVNGAVTIANNGTSSLGTGVIVNSNVSNTAAIAVSKLADGTARQLLQTDAAGTGVEWTNNVDIPGTLDVTGATTLDSTLSVPLGSAAAPSINFAGDNSGIYSPGADQLALSTGGTGRLFVDSSGNVGIGASSPRFNLSLGAVTSTGSATPTTLDLGGSFSSTAGANAKLRLYWDGTNSYGFGVSEDQLDYIVTASGASHIFYADGAERMRIIVESNLSTIRIPSSASINWGAATDNKWSVSANPTDFYIANSDFSKYATLGQNFTSWTFASDRRIKESIVDLDYGIDQLKQIKARRFNFIGETTPSIGFIAQELKEVVPEAVAGTEVPFAEDDTQQERASKTMGVSKDTLIPVLVKALQEAVAKIETLEAKVAALEAA